MSPGRGGARRGLGRIARALGRARVEDTAACARSLTAMLGRVPSLEMLPGGPAQATRALLTARVIQARDPVPWPAAVSRQLDPDDPAFLPPLGLHPVLAARDRSLLGLPGRGRVAWLDPLGWCGVDDGPSVAVWFSDGHEAYPVGRRPDEIGGPPVQVRQEWSDERVGIRTVCTRGDLELSLMHWPVVIEGRVAWALYAKLLLSGPAPRPVRLAFALRPATLEGTAPVFHLVRDAEGLWTADGQPLLALSRTGDELWTGRWGQADPWHRFAGAVKGSAALRPGKVDVRCSVGQASAAEVYRTTLSPGEPFVRLAVVAPPPGTPAALVRTSGHSLWAGASADRRGLLRSGCELQLERHQVVLDAARLRILLEHPAQGVAACLGAVALARLGFTRRAEDRVASWLGRVHRDGSYGEAEDAAVLAWTAAEVARWTGNTAWVREQLPAWSRLLDHLVRADQPEPGGHALLGTEGSARWTALWRAAALLSSASALRDLSPGHEGWALAGGAAREAMPEVLGDAPWSAVPGRAPDGASAALLAACWLGVVPADHPAAAETARHLRERHWHFGGVLLHGGAHPAATALLTAVLARVEPGVDPLDTVARLASPTGALPTARHPYRGALGEGDDLLGAALFALLALDLVQVERGRVRVLPGIQRARDLPTPYGRIDVDRLPSGTRVTGRWRGEPPRVEVVETQPGADEPDPRIG